MRISLDLAHTHTVEYLRPIDTDAKDQAAFYTLMHASNKFQGKSQDIYLKT